MRAGTLAAVLLLALGCTPGGGDPPADAARPDGAIRDGGTVPDAGTDALREGAACSRGGWCWETPSPTGGPIWSMHSPSPGHVVAANAGFLFHFDEGRARWAEPPPPSLTPYSTPGGIWAASPDDVWAHTFQELSHFDGRRWTVRHSVSPGGPVTGFASDDVWAVTPTALHHYDGSAWTEVPIEGIEAVNLIGGWATGPNQLVLTGLTMADRSAFVWRVDGASVTDLELPASTRLPTKIYASGPDDVWVALDGTLHHLSGGSWSTMAGGPGLFDIWGAGPDDLWIAHSFQVDHWDGVTREEHMLGPLAQPLSITGTSSSDVWVADVRGQLHHYDGSSWTVAYAPGVVDGSFESITVGADGVGWAAGGDSTVRTTVLARRAPDGTWTPMPSPTPPGFASAISGVRIVGAETFLFVYDGSFRWDGSDWARIEGDGGRLVDACATFDGTIRAVGNRVAIYEGGAWVDDPTVAVPSDLERIRCLGEEAWASPRRDEATLYFDGSTWSLVPELIKLIGVAAVDGDVFAVDTALNVWRREGGAWGMAAEGPFVGVPGIPSQGVSAQILAANDIWALWGTALLHFDGTSWSDLADPISLFLRALEASPDGTLYASGFHAAVVSRRP